MKQNEVTEGMECYTRVGGARVKVRIVRAEVQPPSPWRKVKRTVFRCVRVDNGMSLPKPRAASALHRER